MSRGRVFAFSARMAKRAAGVEIPDDESEATVRAGRRSVKLTNLDKPFWPALGITKGDLLRTTRTSRRCCCRISPIARW